MNNNTTALAEPQRVSVRELLNGGEVVYRTEGNVEIVLTQKILRALIKVPQEAPPPTEAQLLTFAYTCVTQGLNPYLEECWLSWLGRNKGWTPLVAAQSRVRKAQSQPDYDGYEWGWITEDGTRHAAGLESKVSKTEDIIGVWGRIYRKNRNKPFYHEIFKSEYQKSTQSHLGIWDQKTITMLLKVIRDQTHKFAYADRMGNLMTENEAHFVRSEGLANGEPRSVELLNDVPQGTLEPMPIEEVEKNLEEKLREYRYKCLAKDAQGKECGCLFDEPAGQGKLPLCPKCLSSNVEEKVEENGI